MTDVANLSIRVDSKGVRRATGDLDRLEGKGGAAASTIKRLGTAFAALGAAAAIRSTINSFAEFERGLIGVGKTTNIAGDELAGLGQDIRELSRVLPVASSELLEIAQSAGQLGVNGTANILRFTETVGKLGLSSDLAGEQAATSLARILTVTGTAISDVDRLGSTIVQLGNNFAATESEITSAATRVAQATSQFDVSAAQVLGISTALKAVGVEAEAGGTQIGLSFQAINDALRGGGQELQLLQEVTGRAGDALRDDFFNGKSAQVFQDFINGLGEIQSSGGDVASVLGVMGLNGVRATQVLGTLSTRTDVLADALSQANSEWESNIALNKEAAVASTSFSAQLQLVMSAADEAGSAIGAIIAPAALDGMASFRDVAISVAENIDTVKTVGQGLALVMGANLVTAMSRAVIGMNAASFAATTLKVSMAFLGGPLGVFIIAAGSLFLYARNAAGASDSTALLAKSVDKLTVAGARKRLLELSDNFEDAKERAKDLSEELAAVQKSESLFPGMAETKGLLKTVQKNFDDATKKANEFKRVNKILTDIVNDPDRDGTIAAAAAKIVAEEKEKVDAILAGNIETAAALAAKKQLFQDSEQFLQSLKSPTDLFNDQVSQLVKFRTTVDAETGKALISFDEYTLGIKLAREEMEELIKSGKVENPLIAQADQFAQSIKTSTQLYDDQIEKLNLWKNTVNKATGEALISQKQYEVGVDRARLALDGLNEAAGESKSLFGDLKSASEQWSRSFADSLVEGGLNFENFANGILKQLQKIALEKAFAPVFGEFASGLTKLFQPSTIEGSTASLFGGAPSANGGGFTGSGPRSGGVDGIGGFPAILHPNETVIDHTKGQKSGNSMNIVVNVDASGSSSTGDEDGKNIGNLIGIAVRSVLIEESRPGGMLA